METFHEDWQEDLGKYNIASCKLSTIAKSAPLSAESNKNQNFPDI